VISVIFLAIVNLIILVDSYLAVFLTLCNWLEHSVFFVIISHRHGDKVQPVPTATQRKLLCGDGIMKDSQFVMLVDFTTNYTM